MPLTYNLDIIPVKPESVQRYTGMNDHNGKPIFTKDILDIGMMAHHFQVFEDESIMKVEDMANGQIYNLNTFKNCILTVVH